MSKVYVLKSEQVPEETVGVITKQEVADKWRELKVSNWYMSFELDDPELLNRIAQEGK